MYGGGSWGQEGVRQEDGCGGRGGDVCACGGGEVPGPDDVRPDSRGVAEVVDAVMAGAGELSLGGNCWRGAVELVDLGVGWVV